MIYFIQAGKNGPIKIGQTNNGIEERIAQLQTGCPYELRLLWCYNGDGYTEQVVHDLFKHERIRGEWFRPSPSILEFIRDEMANEQEVGLLNSDPLFVLEVGENQYSIDCCFGTIYVSQNHIQIERLSKKQVVQVHTIREKNPDIVV